jgi:hypothetical protein
VGLEGDGEAVGGGAGQAGGGDQTGKVVRALLQRTEETGGLVNHADAAYSCVHEVRLPSQNVR